MTYRKYMSLMVGGSIALVLVLIAAWLLARFSGEYNRVHADLDASLRALQRLEHRDPYPADENVERLNHNLEQVETFLHDLLSNLARGQVEPETMERAAFPTLIERTILRLYEEARASNVRLPERFTFGFERYALGALPAAEHIPRLTIQVQMIEHLCRMLFEAGIAEVVGIERTEFDLAERRVEPDPTPRRRTPGELETPTPRGFTDLAPREEHDLYSKERFVLTFFTSDPGLWRTLNELASSDLFVVVKNMELQNEADLRGRSPRDLRRPSPDARPASPRDREEARPVTAEERIVAGRERVRVRLEAEVYRFDRSEAEEES